MQKRSEEWERKFHKGITVHVDYLEWDNTDLDKPVY